MKFYHIPEWATYIAMESDGKWYAFEHRPNINQGSWIYEGKREEVYPVIYETLGPVKSKGKRWIYGRLYRKGDIDILNSRYIGNYT